MISIDCFHQIYIFIKIPIFIWEKEAASAVQPSKYMTFYSRTTVVPVPQRPNSKLESKKLMSFRFSRFKNRKNRAKKNPPGEIRTTDTTEYGTRSPISIYNFGVRSSQVVAQGLRTRVASIRTLIFSSPPSLTRALAI